MKKGNMLTKLPHLIRNTYTAFITYNKHYWTYADFYTNYGEFVYGSDEYENIEETATYIKLVELDIEYIKLLTPEEYKIVDYLRYHRHEDDGWEYDKVVFHSAFVKWYDFFKKKQSVLFGKVSAKVLGREMEILRKEHGFTQTGFADTFGVDRKTVQRIEKGERLPSLDYIFQFASLFNCSIDSLIKLAIR